MCRSSQKTLIDFLNYKKVRFNLLPNELSYLYFYACFLQASNEFSKEQAWLEKIIPKSLNELMAPYWQKQLISLAFLENNLSEDKLDLKAFNLRAIELESVVLEEVKTRSQIEKKAFLIFTLNLMTTAFLAEEEYKKNELFYPRLYRVFDGIDEILELDYSIDLKMVVDQKTKERLYQTSGVGVQSGYSTILLAIHHLNLKPGMTFIDLGSGYGRVALIYALLRPDLNFLSYEYVQHRVELSLKAARKLEIHENNLFLTQDLSLDSFKIPLSDVYYLYDPFSEETYHYVLDQIVNHAKSKKLTIVTKGNARKWIKDLAQKNKWEKHIELDAGNLCIFQTS